MVSVSGFRYLCWVQKTQDYNTHDTINKNTQNKIYNQKAVAHRNVNIKIKGIVKIVQHLSKC